MSFARPPEDLGRLPLASLDFVSLDIETTGLDPKSARVVEIAATRVRAGRIEKAEQFSALVNPKMPIPKSSTAIHGITDNDVADAASFRQVAVDFAEWAGSCLFIGYGSDFDSAILKMEHARCNMFWSAPRILDVFRLVPLTSIRVENYGLETVARKLGKSTRDRHRALSDAVMTAEVFLTLIPLLREVSISTYAEAERAASRRRQVPTVLRVDAPPKSAELSIMDSFPFRRRVREVMSAPPATINCRALLSAAVAIMVERGITSLFVEIAGEFEYGILTESDVLRAINKNGADALSESVLTYCTKSLISVSDREFVYRAIVEMSVHGICHLGVRSDQGKLVGSATTRDLVSRKTLGAVTLGKGVKTAKSSAELGRIWSELSVVVHSLSRESVDARNICAIISRELRALTQRACELAELEIGPSPVPYAVLVLGSAGRGESLLAMDQDNAIVYADGSGENADHWFAELGRIASDLLDEAGVRYCKGGVMGANASWRMDVTRWQATIEQWLSRTDPSDILNADIFFDAVCVHGDPRIARQLKSDALNSAMNSKPFLNLLAKRAVQFDSPTGLFGRWRLDDNGRVDLKKCGIMPIFSAARTVALRHGIEPNSTLHRLRAAKAIQPEHAETCDDLIAAQGILLSAILNQQIRDLDSGVSLSNRVKPSELDAMETNQLKWALGRVYEIATILGVPTI